MTNFRDFGLTVSVSIIRNKYCQFSNFLIRKGAIKLAMNDIGSLGGEIQYKSVSSKPLVANGCHVAYFFITNREINDCFFVYI